MKLLVTVIIIVAALFILNHTRKSSRNAQRRADLYPPAGQGTDEHVEQLIRARRKMSAIKLYREIHGVDLKDAKDAVEQISARIEGER